jgi:hypothetical protein
MSPFGWWGNPKLLCRFLGIKKAALLIGSIVGISVAVFSLPQSAELRRPCCRPLSRKRPGSADWPLPAIP